MTAADSTSRAPHLAPRTRRTGRRSSLVAGLLATLAALASACAPMVLPPDGSIPGDERPPVEVSMEWWAMGDSLFAGYAKYPGAPAHLDGVQNFSVAGHTLVEVALFGQPQPTVRQQIEAAIERHGAPEHVLIHAGAADLVGRGFWRFDHASNLYVQEIAALDEWLRGQGVDVWWTTVAPFSLWSIPGLGGQEPLRSWLNDWLRTNLGDRVIDCDAALMGTDGVFADPKYLQPYDGVHVNRRGALAHATCISEQLAAAGHDVPVLTTPR
jgi:hypothetical protein